MSPEIKHWTKTELKIFSVEKEAVLMCSMCWQRNVFSFQIFEKKMRFKM